MAGNRNSNSTINLKEIWVILSIHTAHNTQREEDFQKYLLVCQKEVPAFVIYTFPEQKENTTSRLFPGEPHISYSTKEQIQKRLELDSIFRNKFSFSKRAVI